VCSNFINRIQNKQHIAILRFSSDKFIVMINNMLVECHLSFTLRHFNSPSCAVLRETSCGYSSFTFRFFSSHSSKDRQVLIKGEATGTIAQGPSFQRGPPYDIDLF